MTYPRILMQPQSTMHRNRQDPLKTISFADYSTLEARKELTLSVVWASTWNEFCGIEVYDTFVPLMESLVRVCGMDPRTMAHMQLKGVNPLLRFLHPKCDRPGMSLGDKSHILMTAAVRLLVVLRVCDEMLMVPFALAPPLG